MEEVKDELGERDVREVQNKDVIGEIKTVLAEVKEFDDANGSNSHGVLKISLKKTEELEKMLNEAWNTNLGSESLKESVGDWIFHKPSPMKNKVEYSCSAPGCGSTFTDGRAFRRHLRTKDHGDPKDVVLPMVTCRLPHSKGTRAKDKHTMDQIGSHLYSVSLFELKDCSK